MRTDGPTDRHDEANSRFSHFANAPKNNGNIIKLYVWNHVLNKGEKNYILRMTKN